MNILLINPNRTYISGSKGPRLGLPLGLLYIAGKLGKDGFKPKIFDCLISPETTLTVADNETKHGVSDEVLKKVISVEKPNIAGITNQFTAQIDNAIHVAALVKEVNPQIITVIGGPHVSVLGDKLLQNHKCFDFGIKGEGEYIFSEMVKRLSAGESVTDMKSVIYRNAIGKVETNEFGGFISNLDDLPYPAYHLLDMEKYFSFFEQGLKARPGSKARSISMITSRGCPYNCIFCSIHLHMGKLFRYHSADYVVEHIKYVVEKYNIKHISFEDDNFTLDINRAKKILRGIIENMLKSLGTPQMVFALILLMKN